MTEQEAIWVLKDFDKQVTVKADGVYQTTIGKMACDIAIVALEEIQQYRELGTVEEFKNCKNILNKSETEELAKIIDEWLLYHKIGTLEELREAREKQVPKKTQKYIAFDGITRNGCSNCFEQNGRNEILYAGQKYCSVCGQAILWE